MKVVQTDVSCLESTQTLTKFFKPACGLKQELLRRILLAFFHMQNTITLTQTLW